MRLQGQRKPERERSRDLMCVCERETEGVRERKGEIDIGRVFEREGEIERERYKNQEKKREIIKRCDRHQQYNV